MKPLLLITFALFPALNVAALFKDDGISWANKLRISPDTLCSMPYTSFRVNIYEQAENHKITTIPTHKKYYYAPIALLDHKSATSDYNNVTNQAEMRFRVEMWNEIIEKEIVNYLTDFLEHEVKLKQVQVIPLQEVLLYSTIPSTEYSLSKYWLPYSLQKSLWFTLSCFKQDDCHQLAANMRSKPHQFEHLKLLFSLSSQRKDTVIHIENITSDQFTSSFNFLSTPINLVQNVEFTLTDEWRNQMEALAETRMDLFESMKQLNALSLEIEPLKAISTQTNITINELAKKLNETKVVVMESPRQLDESKPGTGLDLGQVQINDEVKNAIIKLTEAFNEIQSVVTESKKKIIETSLAMEFLKKRVKYRQLLQGEKKVATEKTFFELINGTSSNVKEIEDLINDGVDIDCKNEEGMTPFLLLMRVSDKKENLEEIITLLIHHGADVNAKTNDGWTPLHYLCQNYSKGNLIDIIKLLIQHGADVKTKTNNGRTILFYLCEYYKQANLIDIVPLLIDNHVDVKAKDIWGFTTLHLLCLNYKNDNLIDIIRLLIEKVDANEKTDNGNTARDYISSEYDKENKEEILTLLDGNL